MPPERLAEIRAHSERKVPYISHLVEDSGSVHVANVGREADDYMFDADRDRRELLMLLDRAQVSKPEELVRGMVLADNEGGAWAVTDGWTSRFRLICLHSTERPGWVAQPPSPSHVLAVLAPMSVVWQP